MGALNRQPVFNIGTEVLGEVRPPLRPPPWRWRERRRRAARRGGGRGRRLLRWIGGVLLYWVRPVRLIRVDPYAPYDHREVEIQPPALPELWR